MHVESGHRTAGATKTYAVIVHFILHVGCQSHPSTRNQNVIQNDFLTPQGCGEMTKESETMKKTVAPRSMCQLQPSAAKFLPPVVATGPDRIFRGGCGKAGLLYQPTEPFYIHRRSEDPESKEKVPSIHRLSSLSQRTTQTHYIATAPPKRHADASPTTALPAHSTTTHH
ncbi:unnamed protein product [Ectocarpus sp. 12 AP-2014]